MSVISRLKRLFAASGGAQEPAAGAGAAPPHAATPPNIESLRRYSALCERAGVDRLYLVLTFDCDTDEDIAAARAVQSDLRRRGIAAGFAVPGVQLAKGADSWRALGEAGAEFLNHGARAHAEFREGRYWPVTFYNELAADEVVADVMGAHRIAVDVLGAAPEGFRAPHFGSFQQPEQLALLYDTLRPLGYRYCSTTIPAWALERGPVIDMEGIVELPTMGSYRYPATLLDSWTYLTDRTTYRLGEEYFELFEETVRRMTAEGLPGLLTYYADPAHVLGQAPFERALDTITAGQIPSLLGRDAVRRFRAI